MPALLAPVETVTTHDAEPGHLEAEPVVALRWGDLEGAVEERQRVGRAADELGQPALLQREVDEAGRVEAGRGRIGLPAGPGDGLVQLTESLERLDLGQGENRSPVGTAPLAEQGERRERPTSGEELGHRGLDLLDPRRLVEQPAVVLVEERGPHTRQPEHP